MKRGLLLLAVALTSGCGTFSKPPLPRFALGEAPRPTPAIDPWTIRLRATDVIYFGLTKETTTSDQPVWRMVEAWQNGGARVALGWTDLPAEQQPRLEQWRREEISTSQLLDQIAAPSRRDALRRVLRPDLRQLALGAPPGLLRKIRAGASLSAEESALLPNDYRTPPETLDDFADRVATSARLRRYDVARLYRAHLVAEQMIADNIVRFMHDNPGMKLLVFLPDDAMINPREVADFAAQKSSARQLILDHSGKLPAAHPQLLTAR